MVPYPVQDQQGHADASHQRHHANQSIKKSVAASDSKGRPKGGKSKKRKESYAIYFYNGSSSCGRAIASAWTY